MNDGTKRTLAELVTLHEIEPDLTEVITEGRSDSSLIKWFLRRRGSAAAVYCVSDRLEVPPSEVRARGQSVGNKGRVVAAALNISEASTEASRKISFVYDIDDDILNGSVQPETDCLLHTDYRTIELYAFSASPLDKFLKVILHADDDVKATDVLQSITGPLIGIAFARLLLSRLPEPVAMVDSIEKRCTLKAGSIILDAWALIADSINSVRGRRRFVATRESILAEYDQLKSACTLDPRLVIRGHDFMQICCYYLKTRYASLFREDRIAYKSWVVFEMTLMACLESEDLMTYPLFQTLAQRHHAHAST